MILIRKTRSDTAACGTFEYSDLNAYLLLVTGLAQPEEADIRSFNELARKAREGNKIPIKDVKDLGKKEPLVFLAHTERLTKAVEVLGSGVHRIIVVKEGTSQVMGILSQLRVVKFLWENGKSFPVIDQLYPHYIRDLSIGSQHVVSIKWVRLRRSEATSADCVQQWRPAVDGCTGDAQQRGRVVARGDGQ